MTCKRGHERTAVSIYASGNCRRCNIDSALKAQLKTLYGMSREQYDVMFAAQNGKCAICGRSENKRRLAVDHNHRTKRVRALLCFDCNKKLGVIENKEFHLAAMEYLRIHG